MNSCDIDWLHKWSKFSPDKIAFEDGDSGKTYSYLHASNIVSSLANEFQRRFSLSKGDRIAVVASNYTEYVFLLFVAQKLGAILVPINFRLTPRELQHIISDCTPKLLIYETVFESEISQLSGLSQKLEFETEHGYLSMVANAKESEFVCQSEPEDACMILYTSGTTGSPKGAVITNSGLFWNSVNTSLRLNISAVDITVNFAPFFHTGGWNVLTTPMIHHGGHVVFLKKFDANQIIEIIERRQISIFFGVPTTLDLMMQSEKFVNSKFESVRYAIVGGEPMPLSLIKAWQKKGVPIRQGYGLTEFGPNVFSLNEEDAIRKMGSIGFANFYVQTKVVDSDGNICGPEQIGELLLSGPMCMQRYWQNQEATDSTLIDGWLFTGDLVKFDAEGYFYVAGRKKEMYISGGENVYPIEVEQVLRSMPGIREAAVIGVSDSTWGEVGKAFLVLDDDLRTDKILEYCNTNLAKFKVPKKFTFLTELPKSDSGKILKKSLLV